MHADTPNSIQMGAHGISNSSLTKGQGERKQICYIKFEPQFQKIPHVIASLSMIDSSNQGNLRITVEPKDVTKSGFNLYFVTWADTIIYGATASWIAVQK